MGYNRIIIIYIIIKTCHRGWLGMKTNHHPATVVAPRLLSCILRLQPPSHLGQQLVRCLTRLCCHLWRLALFHSPRPLPHRRRLTQPVLFRSRRPLRRRRMLPPLAFFRRSRRSPPSLCALRRLAPSPLRLQRRACRPTHLSCLFPRWRLVLCCSQPHMPRCLSACLSLQRLATCRIRLRLLQTSSWPQLTLNHGPCRLL